MAQSSYDEVTRILEQCRISHFRQAFLDNECDDSFLDIVEDGDLRELGLPLGPRVRLLKAVAERNAARVRAPAVTPPRAFAPSMAFSSDAAASRAAAAELVAATASTSPGSSSPPAPPPPPPPPPPLPIVIVPGMTFLCADRSMVYLGQLLRTTVLGVRVFCWDLGNLTAAEASHPCIGGGGLGPHCSERVRRVEPVSYTHLRAHEDRG